jgi:hypothetical protein
MLLNIRTLDSAPALQESFSPDLEQDILPPRTAPPRATYSNATPPEVEIQKEKAWHRTAAYMLASGAKISTVAFETGYSTQQIGLLNRQPWFQQLVTTIIHNEFNDDISKMLKGAATEAIMTIRDLATNGTNETTKLKASQDLLDRYRGKATNFVHHTNGALSEKPEEELKRLEEELLTNG